MRYIFIWFLSFVLFSVSGCALQDSHSQFTLYDKKIPLYVEMPQNALVFENVAPILYQNLYRHLLHVGYKLVDDPTQGYTLRTNIIKLYPLTKFVTSQLSLVHQQMTLEVECTLLNFQQKEVVKKRFSYTRLLSKARDPAMTNSFEDFIYTQLSRTLSVRIETFFRPHLLQAFDQDQ